jgi:LPLT family lysophospholipid transporter-like MFS transporter
VGSGHAVAVQHFFENIAMLLATGIYTWSVSSQVSATSAMYVLGIFILVATSIIAYKLPKDN